MYEVTYEQTAQMHPQSFYYLHREIVGLTAQHALDVI